MTQPPEDTAVALSERVDAIAYRWAHAAYCKALGKEFEDIDAIRRELRAALTQPVPGGAVKDEKLEAMLRKWQTDRHKGSMLPGTQMTCDKAAAAILSAIAPATSAVGDMVLSDEMILRACAAFDDGVGDPNNGKRRMEKALRAALTTQVPSGGERDPSILERNLAFHYLITHGTALKSGLRHLVDTARHEDTRTYYAHELKALNEVVGS